MSQEMHWKSYTLTAEQAEEITERAAKQIKQDALDAARYRFILKHARCDLYNMGVDLDWDAPTENLSSTIDAAMASSEIVK